MSLLTFKSGIHPAYKKNSTEASAIYAAKIPKKVVIPLQQHIGAPNKPLVKKGDIVKTGQKIADSEAFVSSPVHASISGKVKAVASFLHPSGQLITSVTIESDEKDELFESNPEKREYADLSSDEIRGIAKDAGIVGLGGAAFPTHVKLSPPKEKKIDAVILNGAECEPYLTADHRLMLEQPEKVVYGLKAIMKSLNVSKGYIGIENNKKDAISAIQNMAGKNGACIEVHGLQVKYPQGAEKMLIKAILNREVPAGGLPMDVGVVVQNVGTTVALTDSIRDHKPVIQRVVTVSGAGVKEPKNLMVRIGTLFSDVIEECGGLNDGARKVIMGGPLMGLAQPGLDIPVVKGTSGIVVLTEDEIKAEKARTCIGCGSCVDVCPMFLLPTRIANFSKYDLIEKAEQFGVMDCIECGCCTYVCPSKIHLVQWIRYGKGKVMEKR